MKSFKRYSSFLIRMKHRRKLISMTSWWRVGLAVTVCLSAAVIGLVWRATEASAPAALATSSLKRPVRWVLPEIVLRPNVTNDAELDTILKDSLLASATSWNDALAGCSTPRLRVVTGSHRALLPVQDGFSTVVVRTKRWCPESARDAKDCYDRDRAAFTSLYPNDVEGGRYGDVREADMELDGVDYEWSLDGDAAGTNSLHAIIAHELGHVLGLDHPCEFSRPFTKRGLTKPKCDNRTMRASIMYPLPLEENRTPVLLPGRGERDALCALYAQPPAAPPDRVSQLR